MQKYAVNQYLVNNILNWVSSGEIAIPEIQRPFVWKAAKVRDLIDSLYQGYPVGYIIAWQNPNIRLKDGTKSQGKKVLIDGQQRVTALTAALLGQQVTNKEYKKVRVTIAFNPLSEKFEVSNPAIQKDDSWINDIAVFFAPGFSSYQFVTDYCDLNEGVEKDVLNEKIERLRNLANKQIGMIELAPDLSIEDVTEIFIRINSKGVVLSQADFAMSKIASHGEFGANLRKFIDYFCHLAVAPEYYAQLSTNDTTFAKTPYLDKIRWLKDENDDLYDPTYNDLLRVAFTIEFNRGKLSDLVSLLSGRNFETRSYDQEIAEQSFKSLESGIIRATSETHFKRFLMIIKSAGYIDKSLISSSGALNFAHIAYLKMVEQKVPSSEIGSLVRRWFVMSVITGRYSASAETQFDQDIKRIAVQGLADTLEAIELGELSDAFWEISLPETLQSTSINNPQFNTFQAAQVKNNTKGFLSKAQTIRDLITHRGDLHHLFPKNFLKKSNPARTYYNQVANFAITEQPINIAIADRPPLDYMGKVRNQCNSGKLTYGGIDDENELLENLREHAIPAAFIDMNIDDYPDFLEERRKSMALIIKDYYKDL
jgi:hypothetical protein